MDAVATSPDPAANLIADQAADQATPPQPPDRLAPVLDAAGLAVEFSPPFGGSWRRDVDGGLTPLDEGTALGAGLRWLPAPAA